MRAPRFLLVDDDPAVIRGLFRLLKTLRPNAQINRAESAERAIRLLDELKYDVVITDLQMPGASGVLVLEELEARHPETVRIVHSSQPESAESQRVRKLADAIIPKPLGAASLIEALERGALAAGLRAARSSTR
ncbi:MAG TPA: response regulator [Polyangiaceae bacterium]|jgi:DNA-binding NarL/FixJ family response regulator